MTTRRNFLRSTALAAVAAHLPLEASRALALPVSHVGVDPYAGPEDPALRELAMRALDAARTAGARYADVRLTADRSQKISVGEIQGTAQVYAGVRALTDGGWGFASSGRCDGDALARLGREAVAQANATVGDRRGMIVLDDQPSMPSGNWTMPVGRDPFDISPDEMRDFAQSVVRAPERLALANVSASCDFSFRRQEKLFASMSGTVQTQTCFRVGPSSLSVVWDEPKSNRQFQMSVPLVALQSGGYDRVTDSWTDARVEELVAAVRTKTTVGLVTVGRYEMVFDAMTSAAIVRSAIGYATELDRIHGDEVNGGGTSYLSERSLGTALANPVVSISATRSLPNGPSTVQWDDEGVKPESFDLVTNGQLVDFATSRASVAKTADRSQPVGRAIRSHGCATADNAAEIPLVRAPDLVVRPASNDVSFEQLVADTKMGVAVIRGDCAMDSQQGTGQIAGDFYEIRNGRVGQYLGTRAIAPFRSSEIWKNVNAVGGASSAMLCGFASSKGEPEQTVAHGVVAVPMKVHDVTLIRNW